MLVLTPLASSLSNWKKETRGALCKFLLWSGLFCIMTTLTGNRRQTHWHLCCVINKLINLILFIAASDVIGGEQNLKLIVLFHRRRSFSRASENWPFEMAEENRLQSFRNIVNDYVGYRLRQKNIFLPGYHENLPPSKAARHLRRVADELIEENSQLFDSMCDQLHLTHATTYPTFVGIADEIFQNGENWGRIVAFLAFGATLAVHCAQKEDLASNIDNIVDWVSVYMNEKLSPWIDDNGGWVSNFG